MSSGPDFSRHISWRDDIGRTCRCGHHKGSHALLPVLRCLTLSIPPVDGGPGCPCLAFEPDDEPIPPAAG